MPSALFDDDPDLYTTQSDGASEESSESDSADEPVEKKPRGKNRQYAFIEVFESKEEFDEWWAGQKDKWRVLERHETKSVETDYYRCQYGKRAKYDCQKVLRVDYCGLDQSVSVFESVGEHNDEPDEKTALSKETKKTILELSETGLAPLRILQVLRTRKVDPLPLLTQIQNVVKKSRKGSSSRSFTVQELREYCESNCAVPEDGDESFVIHFSVESATKFCIAWSTNKLVEKQLEAQLLQLDSTCKLNWYGFPVQVAGFSDSNRRFHPTMLAVSHSEDTWTYSEILRMLHGKGYVPQVILSDGAKSITAACSEVYPAARRAMCWAHVVRQVDKRLNGFKKDLRARLRADLHLLQYARSDAEFETVSNLLFESWPDETKDFVDYLRNVWMESTEKFWYEGAHDFVSTNNGLECHNRLLKQAHTLRRLLPFADFLKVAADISNSWSVSPEVVSTRPKVKPFVYADAYALSKSVRVWRKLSGEDKYIFASEESKIKSADELVAAFEKHTSEYESFQDYASARFNVYVVERVGDYTKCDCRYGAKKKACKHSVMIACLPSVAIDKYPPDAVAERLVQKRKTGRPSQKAGRPHLAEKQNRHAVAD